MKDVIAELLRASMLPQIGDDEQRVVRLRKAAGVLADGFSGADRESLPNALITAVDSHGSAEAPLLRRTGETLREVWETLNNVYPDEPLELYRAVLLQAAVAAYSTDEDLTAAGWYTLRTVVEQLPGDRWGPVLRTVLEECDAVVGPASEQVWTPDRPRARRTKKMPSSEPASIQIDSAARSRAANIVASGAGNWQNGMPQLFQQLEDLVDELVADTEAAATKALRQSGTQLEALVSSTLEELRARVEVQLRTVRASELRTELLWWHAARYSTSLRRRYAELDTEQAVIAAALDVHRLVDKLCPISIEHVLYDTVRAFAAGDTTLDALAKCQSASRLVQDIPSADGTVLHSVVGAGGTPLWAGDAPLPAGRAAVLLFRDLQVARLLGHETR